MSRSPRRAVIIINPLSGRGRHESQVHSHQALATEVLAAHGVEALVRPTTKAGDAHDFARQAVADRCHLVVAWGGDGTVNEAASALLQTDVPLGIVPAGSGNGLASDLLIPFEPRAALRIAATGQTMAIDAGRVGDCLFFNVDGVGIDAVIASRFNERGMRRRGLRAYLQLSSAELLRYRSLTYQLTVDGEQLEHDAMLVAFANGRQYGNRLFIAPGARLDDGLLEVVIVDRMSLLTIAWRLPALFRGTLRSGGGVTMRAARRTCVRAEEPIPFHVDGEPRLGGNELLVEAIPHALKVRVPAAL
jgi:YegS/Rv2252/BmrU family lipid kinase